MRTKFQNIIQKWFDDEWGGSLLLPDGWYGRPYDNQHMLTSIEESDNKLTIILDQKLKLCFEGLKSVKTKKQELVFGQFEKLIFDCEDFSSKEQHSHKEYQNGEVKLLSR